MVELIVVIAIMAILAGIAVPTYSKYIAKANDAAVMAELDAVKTAAYGAATAAGETLVGIAVDGSGNITITTDAGASSKADITALLDDTTVNLEGTSYEENGVSWTVADGWK